MTISLKGDYTSTIIYVKRVVSKVATEIGLIPKYMYKYENKCLYMLH